MLARPIYKKGPDVLLNQLAMGAYYGVQGIGRHDFSEISKLVIDPKHRASFVAENSNAYENFRAHVRQLTALRRRWAIYLEYATLNPQECLKDSTFQWRRGQSECLESFTWALRHGHQRLAAELTMGSGKTHILGALVWSYFMAARGSVFQNQEILGLTSRENLLDQMGGTAQRETKTFDHTIKYGDLSRWMASEIAPEEMNVLSDNWQLRRNGIPVLTLGTYQGFDEERIGALHQRSPVGLIILDEAHNLTERVRMLINHYFPNAFLVGVSGTIKGPERDPFLTFERVIRKPGATSLEDTLAHYESIMIPISNGELKRPRQITGKVDLGVDSETVLTDDEIALRLSRNPSALKRFIFEIWTAHHPVLELSGSKPLRDRTHIMFVRSVALAKELTEFCRSTLGMRTECLTGNDPDFESKREALRNRDLDIGITCKKAGEGFDAPNVDALWRFAPHGEGSEWMVRQELGRGLRFDPDNPNGDLVIIEPTYSGAHHNLATTSSVFGGHTVTNGSLLIPGEAQTLEQKIYALQKQGIFGDELRGKLTDRECALANTLGWRLDAPQNVSKRTGEQPEPESMDVAAISFAFGYDIADPETFARMKRAKELLAAQNYIDRESLLRAGVRKLRGANFDGMGIRAFHKMVTGIPVDSWRSEHLKILADIFFPMTEKEQLQHCRFQLAACGVFDRASFLAIPASRWRSMFIGGKQGAAFYRRVTGRSLGADVLLSVRHVKEMVDILFPETPETRLAHVYHVLENLGIEDYFTMMSLGPKSFAKLKFGTFGNQSVGAVRLYSQVTGKYASLYTQPRHEELAQALFPTTEEDKKRYYRDVLAQRGFLDADHLLEVSVERFQKVYFPGIGKGKRFYGAVTGKQTGTLTRTQVAEIVTHLFVPSAQSDQLGDSVERSAQQ